MMADSTRRESFEERGYVRIGSTYVYLYDLLSGLDDFTAKVKKGQLAHADAERLISMGKRIHAANEEATMGTDGKQELQPLAPPLTPRYPQKLQPAIPPPPPQYPKILTIPKASRRSKWLFAIVIIVVLGLTAGLMALFHQRETEWKAAGPQHISTTPEGVKVYAVYCSDGPPYGWRYFAVGPDGNAVTLR